MVDGHQDMERWGVYCIFKEAGRLLYQHFRIFRPFILAFMLPVVLIVFLELIGFAWLLTWSDEQGQPHHMGVIFGHHRHFGFHVFHAAFSKAPIPPNLVLIFVVNFLVFMSNWLLISLASAAIAKAIHHIYSSNDTTSPNEDINSSQTQNLTQSIFTSFPHCFYRIFIISLCFFVVDILNCFFLALPFSLLSGPWFNSLHIVLWNLIFLIFNFWFFVSIQVTVLESQYYGWAVLQRSAKLVKAKAVTALGLLGVYIVYFFVLGEILVATTSIPSFPVILYVVEGMLVVPGHLVFGALWLLAMTVFYFVSKCSSRGVEEGRRQAQGEQYQALDVSAEN